MGSREKKGRTASTKGDLFVDQHRGGESTHSISMFRTASGDERIEIYVMEQNKNGPHYQKTKINI